MPAPHVPVCTTSRFTIRVPAAMRRFSKLAVVASALWASAALLACSGGVPNYPYDKEPDPRGAEYTIGTSDALEISVWKNGELDTKTTVRPDGTITMPLIGDVTAAGLTPTQLKAEITKRLSAYLRAEDAIVTVAVSGVNSYYVTVSGNVGGPGRYAAQTYLTVSDAIALAGGPNRFASPEKTIIVRRNPDGSVRRIPVNYELIKEGEGLQMDLVLLRGDQVFVP
jgi:polysaccharide biosynthesis/export protein